MVVASALLGFLLGLPSRRLIGDYLAIVTLFFAQIFVVLTTNADRITLPWNDSPTDFTGGPNGIADLDPFEHLRVSSSARTTSYLARARPSFALVFTGAPPAERIAHRPRLAGAARGFARRRADEHARSTG